MKIRSFILVLFLAVAAMAQAQLPSVTLKDINGKTINTANLSNDGKPFIISFFATWCKPCNRELTAISEVYDEWKEETSWHNVVAWTSKYVHNLEQLKKGMFVEIVGKLRYTRYTSKSGEERFITEIVASKLTIPSDAQDESL